MLATRCNLLLALIVSATAFVPPTQRRSGVALRAGFGGAATKKTKKFVKPGKKDLEKQWENFFVHQRSGSRLFACESVWARAGADGEWQRIGAVVTKSDDVSNADAVAAQKKLISWSATQLFPALNAKKGQAPELGLGPYVDDEKDDDGDASKVAPVGKGDKAAPLSDVGFKPIRSPLDEHRAGLGATLLNKSVGKGSAKFKGAAAASAAPGAAADSKGVL